ncbi:MAG: hypothetical protein NWE93_06250 [Candidatus Bathyarchaeota archaeon]|nr:hypothetical protein [Candidatus Bathyarchaeota archaeon]
MTAKSKGILTDKEITVFFSALQTIDIDKVLNLEKSDYNRSTSPFTGDGHWHILGEGNDGNFYRLEFISKTLDKKQSQQHRDSRENYLREQIAKIENTLVKAGRFEEAAIEYELLQMFEEAGRVRSAGRTIVTKTVSVDLNHLLDQVKEGGIVSVYACPHCGGKLKVEKNSTIERLSVCQHCNNEIQAMDLASFLKAAL